MERDLQQELNDLQESYNSLKAHFDGYILEHDLVVKELKEREETYRMLFDSIDDAVFISESMEDGKSNRFVKVNKIACQRLGYSEEELLTKSSADINSERMQSMVASLMQDLLKRKHTVFETEHVTKDGRTIPVEISTNTEQKNGKFIFHSIARDISERKKAEMELIKSKELAEQSNRLKTAFLANMSHEIRTPMNGILGFAGLLKEQDLTGEDKQSYINLIEKSGARMLNLINDLIDISKVESGMMELSITYTNLNDKLDFLYHFFKTEAAQKGLEIVLEKKIDSEEAIVSTDQDKLFSILSNLVKNAIKFTKKGSIKFGGELKGENFEFFIRDTGIGIEKEKQNIIFDRFMQADSSLSRGFEGAGLGLSISKAYVEMLGGEIWLESEVDVGSCFYFTLPRVKKPVIETAIIEPITPKVELKNPKKTVLIAEDDEDSMIYLTILIRNMDFKFLQATSGTQAVEICRNNPDIDLILMDIKMPFMDGVTATKLIREFRPDQIVVAQTAYALEIEKEKYGEIFNAYLTKPVNANELRHVVNKYLVANS
ncbi:MAG: ATP-binding protein [Prolixibacteraceae bacterium]|jgi:PAS domain S-box-containing protein|nr:ATP-binding protein [Prolixibacteraceae bacterium]